MLNSKCVEGEEVAIAISDSLGPEVLFDNRIVSSEGRVIFAILRDVMRSAGLVWKSTRTVPLPIQVARLLYVSEDFDNLSEEDQKDQMQAFMSAERLYREQSFPLSPRRHAHTPGATRTSIKHSSVANDDQESELRVMADASISSPRLAARALDVNAKKEDGTQREKEHIDGNDVAEDDHRVPREEHTEHQIRGHGPMIPRTGIEQDVYNDSMAAARKLRQDRESSGSPGRGDRRETSAYRAEKSYNRGSTGLTSVPYAMSKKKSTFTHLLLKRYEKESMLFTGTDNNSWAVHLRKYTELGKSHDIEDQSILLSLVQWTLGPGPRMSWERYASGTNAS